MHSTVTEVALQLVESIQQQMAATGVIYGTRLWLDEYHAPQHVQSLGVGLIVAAFQLFQSLISKASAAGASTEGVYTFTCPMP